MARIGQMQVAFSTASNAANFTAKSPTITEPTGNGIHSVLDYSAANGPESKSVCEVIVFGTGSENNSSNMRVWGWQRDNGSVPMWIPKILVEVNATLSSFAGNAQAQVTNAMLFADVLVLGTDDPADPDTVILNSATANTSIARCQFDVSGFDKIEFDGKKGNSTNINALFHLR